MTDRTDHYTSQKYLADKAAEDNMPDDDQLDIPLHELDAATVLAMMLLLIPPTGKSGKLSAGQVKYASRRLFVLAAVVCPEIGAGGLTAISDALTGAGISTTRACISHLYLQLSNVTGASPLGKSTAAREVYSQTAKKVWALRERKPKKEKEA